MKKWLMLLILLVFSVPSFGKQIDGKLNPEKIPDAVAGNILFSILYLPDGSTEDEKQAVEAYYDYVLQLTQPQKEYLRGVVQQWGRVIRGSVEVGLADPNVTEGAKNELKEMKKTLANGLIITANIPNLTKQLQTVKKDIVMDEGDEQ